MEWSVMKRKENCHDGSREIRDFDKDEGYRIAGTHGASCLGCTECVVRQDFYHILLLTQGVGSLEYANIWGEVQSLLY